MFWPPDAARIQPVVFFFDQKTKKGKTPKKNKQKKTETRSVKR